MTSPKKGLFIGSSHDNGGIPSEVKETGQQIEIEGDEYYICNEAYNSSKEYSFKDKTNKQILDKIYSENSCRLNQSLMAAGDFIICKVAVRESSKHSRSGTIKDIVNEIQGEKSCKVENGNSSRKLGGVFKNVNTRTIKRKDGTTYEVKVYSEEELLARSEKKKDSLKNLAQNISKLRSVVNEDLKSENEKDFLTALAVYIMLETSERVGNGTSAENGHYGVTGLKTSHIKILGNTVNFDYTGKSGVKHDKEVTSQKLSELLTKAIENSPTDEVFVTSNGFKIKSDKINRYLKKLGVSAKDIRGYSANNWIISKLNRLTPEDTDTKRKKQFNEVVKAVALKVGHGAATLKKHYLLPEIQMNWIEKGKVTDLANFKQSEMKFGGAVKTEKEKEKIAVVMGEFKDGDLKTSHGKKVTNRKQAVAIALSEADRMKNNKSMENGGVLSSEEVEDFEAWKKEGNAEEVSKGVWIEQTTQWKKKFTHDELNKFFKREYLEQGGGIKKGSASDINKSITEKAGVEKGEKKNTYTPNPKKTSSWFSGELSFLNW